MLLGCARATLTPAARARLGALQATPLDWDVILDEAGRHGVIPLLHLHAASLDLPRTTVHELLRTLVALRYLEELPALPAGRDDAAADMVAVPAGRYPVGSDGHEPYDNEHPCHEVALAAFEIDRFPVSNGDYLRFLADGGYERQELWSADGWEWRFIFGVEAPEYWARDGAGWTTTRYGRRLPVDERLPVSHVSY